MNNEKDLSGGVSLHQFDERMSGNDTIDTYGSTSKVLIADDMEIQRKHLRAMLVNAGIQDNQILIAKDSQQAMDLWEVNKEQIKALILDNNMPSDDHPDLQGIDIIEHISQESKDTGRQNPIMMLHSTSLEPGGTMSRVDNAGAIGVSKGEMSDGHISLIKKDLGISTEATLSEEHAPD